jgi:AraC-like ligand binding domain
MTANLPRTRIWRSQYLKSIELIHGVHQNYSSPRHLHEELELNIKQGDGWKFNYRGAIHSVPPDTLVVTQPGEAHQADSKSDRDCTFRGLRVSMDLLQQVATDVAGRDIELPLFPLPIVRDRDIDLGFISTIDSALCRKSTRSRQTRNRNSACPSRSRLSRRTCRSRNIVRAIVADCELESISSQSIV